MAGKAIVGQVAVDSTPVKLFGGTDIVTIRNIGDDDCWINVASDATPTESFLLGKGEDFQSESSDDVYAVCDAEMSTRVCWWGERGRE
jgi:hypothetical protein